MTILVLKNKIYIDKIKTVYNEKLILNLLKTMPGKNIDEKNISNIVEELKNKYRFKLENVEITVEELYKKLKNIREDIFKYLSKRFDTKTSIDILNLFFIKYNIKFISKEEDKEYILKRERELGVRINIFINFLEDLINFEKNEFLEIRVAENIDEISGKCFILEKENRSQKNVLIYISEPSFDIGIETPKKELIPLIAKLRKHIEKKHTEKKEDKKEIESFLKKIYMEISKYRDCGEAERRMSLLLKAELASGLDMETYKYLNEAKKYIEKNGVKDFLKIFKIILLD